MHPYVKLCYFTEIILELELFQTKIVEKGTDIFVKHSKTNRLISVEKTTFFKIVALCILIYVEFTHQQMHF